MAFSARFLWCIRCARVYPAIWWVENRNECPNPTCAGTLDEPWAWGEALLSEHPDWPEEPEAGEHYEL
jgi:hypothetical protein